MKKITIYINNIRLYNITNINVLAGAITLIYANSAIVIGIEHPNICNKII